MSFCHPHSRIDVARVQPPRSIHLPDHKNTVRGHRPKELLLSLVSGSRQSTTHACVLHEACCFDAIFILTGVLERSFPAPNDVATDIAIGAWFAHHWMINAHAALSPCRSVIVTWPPVYPTCDSLEKPAQAMFVGFSSRIAGWQDNVYRSCVLLAARNEDRSVS